VIGDVAILAHFVVIGLLAWVLAGYVVLKLAERAGYTFGWYDGQGIGCRAWIILQAPALLIDQVVLDLHYPEEPPLMPRVARMLWVMFKDPRLDPDGAFERLGPDEPTGGGGSAS